MDTKVTLPEQDGVYYVRLAIDAETPWWIDIQFYKDSSEILLKHRRRRAARQADNSKVEQVSAFEETYLDFWDSVLSFLTGLDFLQVHGAMLSGMMRGLEVRKLLDERAIIKIKERERFVYYSVRETTLVDALKIIRSDTETIRFTNNLPTLLVPALMATFDSFVMRTISNILTSRPEIAKSMKKQISLAELLDFPTIEVARASLIEKEIQGVMRDSHESHINWIGQVLKVPLEPEGRLKTDFFELCERRNIITHNGGRINKIYLENCAKYGLDTGQLDEGAAVATDAAYVFQAVNCVVEMATKISQVVWRKVDPATQERAEKTMNHITYELIKRERYELANRLFDFCRNDFKKWASDPYRLQNIVNHANALRLSGDKAGAEKLIDTESWVAKSLEYKISVAAVREDVAEVVSLLKGPGIGTEIKEIDLLQWPVFRGIRETSEFRAAFKEVFGVDSLGQEEPENTSTVQNSATP